ncbi:SRPBCC domain-containing protein [Leucobacter tenebrionis]|uniref:SRPBCC domain-containing protein n=1 Tax=Leucobacter tenebrionis TaxID=2873270 RepID=UPI001CA7582E|nr:SRPBCC domain-containing protein [Leucobacter tenebrionis]QZY51562.1 SRPBCC domain-containing protein [Leucobacter tenebrionis]
MPRTDTAAREVAAAPDSVYAAFVDPDALLVWLPPAGMRAAFERFDARPGGSYRMVLSYEDPAASPGKRGDGTDAVEARFVELVPGERVVQDIDFESPDPAYRGTMRMTWRVSAGTGGPNSSRVEIRAENVPSGISAAEHAVGLASSLANLARMLET